MFYRYFFFGSLLMFLATCAAQPSFDSAYEQVTPGSLQAGARIPEASAEPIITVTGKIKAAQLSAPSEAAPTQTLPSPKNNAQSNSDRRPQIVMDRASLNAVGLVEYAVEDPFEKKTNTFRGVLFRDLLSLWQVPDEAEYLTMTALNDYQIQVPISLLREYPVIMALEQNGHALRRDYRGPAMLVAPLDQYPAVKELAHQEYWIWQITTVHVE